MRTYLTVHVTYTVQCVFNLLFTISAYLATPSHAFQHLYSACNVSTALTVSSPTLEHSHQQVLLVALFSSIPHLGALVQKVPPTAATTAITIVASCSPTQRQGSTLCAATAAATDAATCPATYTATLLIAAEIAWSLAKHDKVTVTALIRQ